MSRRTLAAARHALLLAPRAATVGVPEALLVFVGAAALAFPRPGAAAFHGVIWAEDGAVALQGAYHHHGVQEILTAYQGYAMVLPRVVVSLISFLPVASHGLAVNLAAVAVQAALATFAFHVVRSHVHGRAPALLVAAGVAVVPVGPEVAGNLVNLQWFLLFAACLAPLWQPRTGVGRAASILVLGTACVSSPFGVIPMAVSAVSWWVHRGRHLLVLLAVGAACLAVQVVVMITAPPRQIPTRPHWDPLALAVAWLRHVAGDGILGVGRYPVDARTSQLLPGIAVAILVGLLALAAVRVRPWGPTAAALLVLASSGLTFVAPVGLSGLTGSVPPSYSGRYAVAPTLLLYVAIALLADRALLAARATSRGPRTRPTLVGLRLVSALLVIAVGYGWLTSWHLPAGMREDRPWPHEVARGRAACAAHSGSGAAPLRIAPPGWSVLVPCSRLVADR